MNKLFCFVEKSIVGGGAVTLPNALFRRFQNDETFHYLINAWTPISRGDGVELNPLSSCYPVIQNNMTHPKCRICTTSVTNTIQNSTPHNCFSILFHSLKNLLYICNVQHICVLNPPNFIKSLVFSFESW